MIVNSLTVGGKALRTFAMFVVIGFLALTLGPPLLGLAAALLSLVLALVSVFLPFAIIGLFVWFPYHLATHGGEATWQRTREVGRGIGRVVLMPVHLCGGVWTATCSAGRAVSDFNKQVFRFLGLFLFEGLCGALVGLVVALLTGPQPLLGEHVAICVGIGAALGGLIGIARFRPREEVEPVA